MTSKPKRTGLFSSDCTLAVSVSHKPGERGQIVSRYVWHRTVPVHLKDRATECIDVARLCFLNTTSNELIME